MLSHNPVMDDFDVSDKVAAEFPEQAARELLQQDGDVL
jgi:hypothetical protein